jgi:hypothetical protein
VKELAPLRQFVLQRLNVGHSIAPFVRWPAGWIVTRWARRLVPTAHGYD